MPVPLLRGHAPFPFNWLLSGAGMPVCSDPGLSPLVEVLDLDRDCPALAWGELGRVNTT
jgi:hypothetical protein